MQASQPIVMPIPVTVGRVARGSFVDGTWTDMVDD
jgi:hypothetical protein